MEHELHIRVQEYPYLTTIHLRGHLAQLEVYKLKKIGDSSIGAGRRFMIVELTDISTIDSAGIGSISHLFRACEQAGGQLVLACGSNSPVLTMIGHSQLHTLIPIVNDVDEALAWLRDKYGLPAACSPDTAAANERIVASIDAILAKIESIDRRLNALEAADGKSRND